MVPGWRAGGAGMSTVEGAAAAEAKAKAAVEGDWRLGLSAGNLGGEAGWANGLWVGRKTGGGKRVSLVLGHTSRAKPLCMCFVGPI